MAHRNQIELFAVEDDPRLPDLRSWIRLQWAFAHIFWPTEPQIVRMARRFKVLCETVIVECDSEFRKHCIEEEYGV